MFYEIVLLNPCSIFRKNFILSFIEKVPTGTKKLALFISNVALVVAGTTSYATGLVFGTALNVLDMILHNFFVNLKFDLQKLLKYFKGTATSVPNILLLFGMLPNSFVSYSKDLYVIILLL